LQVKYFFVYLLKKRLNLLRRFFIVYILFNVIIHVGIATNTYKKQLILLQIQLAVFLFLTIKLKNFIVIFNFYVKIILLTVIL